MSHIWGHMVSQGFPGGATGTVCLPMQETQETWVQSLCWEDQLESEVATDSGILA